jgi:hypothetical protein
MAEKYEGCNVSELKKALKARNAKTSGRKSELIER